MSCAVMRTRSPLCLTLPSRTYRAPSSRPTCRMSTALPLYWKLEFRAMTRKFGELRQLGDDVLCEPIAEIVLLRVAIEIGKRKDCDRWLARERQFRLRLLRRPGPWRHHGQRFRLGLFAHSADEAEALAGKCLNQ